MGSHDTRFPDDGEGPVRKVTVAAFAIASYAVSNLQFGEFVRGTGYTTDAERYGWSFVFEGLLPDAAKRTSANRAAETPWWMAVPHAYWAQPEGPHSTILERLDHPVVHISWNDAKAYCQWSQTRLPTEAEWELAARGGLEQAAFPWGDELTPAGEHRCNIWQGKFPALNTTEDGYLGTAPVHAFAANGYGLFNVAGNVWEWCEDTFSPRYHQVTESENPSTARQHLTARCAAAHSFATTPTAIAIAWPRAARTHRIALRAILDFESRARPRRPQSTGPSLRAGAARHDLLVQFLIDGLDGPVDLGTGHAELIGNQLHQEVDPLDERCAAGHCPRRR